MTPARSSTATVNRDEASSRSRSSTSRTEIQSSPSPYSRAIKLLLVFILLVFPLFFGGVHPPSYLAAFTLVFLLTGYVGFSLSTPSSIDFALPPLTKKIALLFGVITAYLVLQGAFGFLFQSEHPVLGSTPSLWNPREFVIAFYGVTAFFALCALTRVYCYNRPERIDQLLRIISLSGFIISTIALSHWFYDTGKLFWLFEPISVFASTRARWPFVSSNNLAHALDLTLFHTLYFIIRDLRKLLLTHDKLASKRSVTVLDLLNTAGVQPLLFMIMLDVLSALGITLALFASQSRGSWLGVSIALLLFVLGDYSIRKRLQKDAGPISLKALRDKRVRSRPLEGTTLFDSMVFVIRKFSTFFAICGSFVLLTLFLRDQGLEMVLDRAQYGLLASKDDIRWQMYKDTLPMIKDHMFFGVGLSGWDHMYGSYVTPELARLTPVYLHSDPLQLLASLGIVGFFPFLWITWIVAKATLRIIKAGPLFQSASALAMSASLFAVIFASLFDFPFRIPSIALTISILLGMLVSTIE